MNILLLGNGFDLAHGLPTRYVDFLEFLRLVKKEINYVLGFGKEIEFRYGANTIKVVIQIDEWRELIYDNTWIEYFLSLDTYINENWIDFESEISRVIQIIDGVKESIVRTEKLPSLTTYKQKTLSDIIKAKSNEDGTIRTVKEVVMNEKQIDDFVSELEIDLKKLIRALELYLEHVVNKIECTTISPDIWRAMQCNEINCKGVGKILSFNYTQTFSKYYSDINIYEYDYIHGRVQNNSDLENNNMVLGIDEYLPPERKNEDITFIRFKKFFQRIHKQTGCDYKEWLEEIQCDARKFEEYTNDESEYTHRLYIFGHSLDVTDKDVLCALILNDNVMTTIFYRNKEQYGQQIANLVKVIGQDELIKRTGGKTRTIYFKKQDDMITRY